jgi:hypothetical protein
VEWIGGSILSSLFIFQQVWISKAEYDEPGEGEGDTCRSCWSFGASSAFSLADPVRLVGVALHTPQRDARGMPVPWDPRAVLCSAFFFSTRSACAIKKKRNTLLKLVQRITSCWRFVRLAVQRVLHWP